MCSCSVKDKPKNVMKVNHSWRLNRLWKIESLIRDTGDTKRAKRMGICGNTIMVYAKKGDLSSVLFEPQVRCKDRLCPVCNSYRASILARKAETLGEKMSNPHLLTVTANALNRFDLITAFKCYKVSSRLFKRERTWFKKYVKGGIEHIEITYSEEYGWHIHSHMLVDLAVDRKVENMRLENNGYFLDPIKKDLQHVLLKVGLGVISDIRPVTEGYGKEISKYAMKIGKAISDDRLKEIIIHMKGKRMVSKFGNCYGVKKEESLEELTEEESSEYEYFGTIEEVVHKAFYYGGVESDLVSYVMDAIKIGLITLEYAGSRLLESNRESGRDPDHYCVC